MALYRKPFQLATEVIGQKELKDVQEDPKRLYRGTFEKKHGLPAGTIRNRDGRDTRSDKLIGTIRREAEKLKKK